jgi:hypothetical protein
VECSCSGICSRMIRNQRRAYLIVRLPIADVEITLKGYSRTEAEHFLDRFHLVFRKGGG